MSMSRAEIKARSYRKHRDANLAYAAAYRAAHREEIKLRTAGKHSRYQATYREKNYEKCLQWTREWKAQNREKHRAYCAAWTKANPLKNRLKEHIRRARKAASGGRLSEGVVTRLMGLQRGRCACCGKPLAGRYDIDHIIPLAAGGLNIDSNVQLLLPECNRRKGAKDPIVYMQSRGRLL